MRIKKEILEEIYEQAKADFPNEVCGIIGGTSEDGNVLFKTVNADQSPITYSIDPKDLFRLTKELRARELDMVAIYHSHVATEPYPSDTDVRNAFYPDSNYLIISLEDFDKPYAKAYKIVDKKISEVDLEIY